MKVKLLALFVAFLLIPGYVFGWTDTSHMDGVYPSVGGNWSCQDSSPGHGSIIKDDTSPDLSSSLRLTYPTGFYNGNYAAKCWNMIPGAPTELWVQYYFKYSNNYYFHPIDNKQTYYFTGGSDSSNNWYITVNGSHQVNVVTQTFATDRHYPNAGYDPYISANQWYKITAHFVMNKPGALNGILQILINDRLVINKSDVGYISQPEGIREAQIAPVFGGMSTISKPAEDYQYYDYVIISTSSIPGGAPVPPPTSGTTPPQPATKSPMPPSELQIQ